MKLIHKKQVAEFDAMVLQDKGWNIDQLVDVAALHLFRFCENRIDKLNTVGIVCGVGNNAADGLALSLLLAREGYQVSVYCIKQEELMHPVCQRKYQVCKSMGIHFVDELHDWDILIDAIFGVGLSREISGLYANVISQINERSFHIISIDIASGIDSDSGEVWGIAVQAHETFTLVCGKPGLYVYPGRIYSGDVCIVEIAPIQRYMDSIHTDIYKIEKNEMSTYLPKRSTHSNKGSYGHVLCIGGSYEMCGAISLAALSALKSGCGLVTCAIPNCIYEVVANRVLESTYLVSSSQERQIGKQTIALLNRRIPQRTDTCLLIGCGIGRSEELDQYLHTVLGHDKMYVIDADGLYAMRNHLDALQGAGTYIITPHLKEFATLFSIPLEELINHSLHYIKEISKQYPKVIMVVKSESTCIARNGVIYINTYGNNGLAKGGSGDVLAGIIAGVCAQSKNPLHAAILGVFLHAYSAQLLLEEKTVYSLLPSDVFSKIDGIIKGLEEEK